MRLESISRSVVRGAVGFAIVLHVEVEVAGCFDRFVWFEEVEPRVCE